MSDPLPRGAESPAATGRRARLNPRRTSYPDPGPGINAEAFSLRDPSNMLWALIAAAPDSEADGPVIPVEDWPDWTDIPLPRAFVAAEGGEG